MKSTLAEISARNGYLGVVAVLIAALLPLYWVWQRSNIEKDENMS